MTSLYETAPRVPIAETITPEQFRTEIVPAAKPVVLKGAASHWPMVRAAEQDTNAAFSLIEQASLNKPIQAFYAGASTSGRFFYSEDLLEFNFERVQTTLTGLIDHLRSPETAPHPYFYAGAVNLPQHAPSLLDQHTMPLLPAETEKLISLWIGNRTRIPAHWDLPQNLACVISGRRAFTLFPTDAVPDLYIGPLDRTLAGQPCSLVDLHQPDLTKFPRFKDALPKAQVAILDPGDVLYIPSLWLHAVESLTDIGMMLNFWWRDGPPHLMTPQLTLFHALLTLKGMPKAEQAAWRILFDHYIFEENGDPIEHLPEAARGVLGEPTPNLLRMIKDRLQRSLGR